MGIDLAGMVARGKLAMIYLRPLDLSVDETLVAILDEVERLGATRVVIDSLSGFEVALAPAFREDFRESLYRLVGALTATGVTVVMTAETSALPRRVDARPRVVHHGRHHRAAICGDRGGTPARVGGGQDARERAQQRVSGLRDQGAWGRHGKAPGRLSRYHDGRPRRQRRLRDTGYAGLTEREGAILDVLIQLREASPSCSPRRQAWLRRRGRAGETDRVGLRERGR